MKSMLTGGQSGRRRQSQKGDAVGLTLGLRYFLRNQKSSIGFSFLQRGVLSFLFIFHCFNCCRDNCDMISES
jgi:hypothetical protein